MIVFFFKKLSYYHYRGVLGERKVLSTQQGNQNRAHPHIELAYTHEAQHQAMLIHENWWNCVQLPAG